MDRLIRDLRHALRMLRKTPVFTTVVVFTLAVGIGANTAMFSIVNGVLLQGLPFKHADRIVDLNEVERRDIGGGGAIAPATFFDWRKMATSYDVPSVTFISLPLLLGVVAFLAGLFPALRASRIDPLEALRVD